MRKLTLRYCGTLTSLLGPLLLSSCQDNADLCSRETSEDGTSRLVCAPVGGLGTSTLAIRRAEPAGDNCPNGGERIDTGFDDNANNILDASEIDVSAYICNGADGIDGINGANGADGDAGPAGASAFVTMDAEQAGENCADGGMRVSYGVDANADGTLQDDELEGIKFVCDGADGDDGTDGTSGINGTDGDDGIGYNSLVLVEGDGDACKFGGFRYYVGVDDGGVGGTGVFQVVSDEAIAGDGILQDAEIDSDQLVCNGQNGLAGANGSTGANGSDGANGATGPAGPGGAAGTNGATGATGADGAVGATGPAGPSGVDGTNGATGATGDPGAAGATGATGDPGAAGATGATGDPGADGATGATGDPGADGATGATGDPGADGATGATGPAGDGAEIPFASGLPVSMTTELGGVGNKSALIGFGGSTSDISTVGGEIDLTGSPGTLTNFAFSASEDSTITSMSGFFSTTTGQSLVGSTVTVTVQLYRSTTPDNTFTVVPGAVVTLGPPLTGITGLGTISDGDASGLSIPVTQGTRLLFVATSTVTGGIDVNTTVSGYVSGGVTLVGTPDLL
jgi:BclB C-terminal domain-containing protein